MPDLSCGIVLFRRDPGGHVEVLLGHLGGPYWAKRDAGAWSIPKGLPEPGERPIDAARREFTEELGLPLPSGDLVELGEIRQSSRKTVAAWALELVAGQTLALDAIVSNTFEAEWPPRSGRMQSFPEIDRAAWFDVPTAREKMVTGQAQLLEFLTSHLGAPRRAICP